MTGAISSISSLFVGATGSYPSGTRASAPVTPVPAVAGRTPQDTIGCSICGQDGHFGDLHSPEGTDGQKTSQTGQTGAPDGTAASPDAGATPQPGEKKLDKDQEAQVAKLKQVDRSVRAHEQAHAATGGSMAGAPSYHYTTGPDGNQYAIGGEVPISVPGVSSKNPEASIQQLRQVIAAATAPADPSSQDRAVAAQAQAAIATAQAEAAKQAADKAKAALGNGGDGQAKTDEAAAAPGIATPQIVGPKPVSADSGATKGDDAAEPAPVPVIGPQVFGSRPASGNKPASESKPIFGSAGDKPPQPAAAGETGNSGRATPLHAYQQAQSGFGQSRPRGSNAVSLSI
jgi:hypothetical protein